MGEDLLPVYTFGWNGETGEKKGKRKQGAGKWEAEGSPREGVQLPRGGDAPFRGGVQDDTMVLLSAVRMVRMVRRPGRRMSSIELLLLSKGRRGSEQLVVGKAWMNTEVEGIEGVGTY